MNCANVNVIWRVRFFPDYLFCDSVSDIGDRRVLYVVFLWCEILILMIQEMSDKNG